MEIYALEYFPFSSLTHSTATERVVKQGKFPTMLRRREA